MCSVFDEILAEGRKEGKLEGIKAVVASMLQSGKYSLAELAKHSGLSIEEVKALQASMNKA